MAYYLRRACLAVVVCGAAASGPFASTLPAQICDPGGSGLFFPCFPRENHWDKGFRGVLYFCGMVWMFLGVSVVSDVFMMAIEQITSEERILKGTDIKVKVWNPTVANLTLMALGTSSPEILLSVIEIMSNDFFMGDLGAGVIVGSASFNLLVITAICVSSLPDGETRILDQTQVFCVTSFFSLFAYIWVYVILVLSSPNVVEIWEAVVTLTGFPAMVISAYLSDIGYFSRKKIRPMDCEESRIMSSQSSGSSIDSSAAPVGLATMTNLSAILKKITSDELSKEETARLVSELAMSQSSVKPSKAQLRMAAMRNLTSPGKRRPSLTQIDPKLLAKIQMQNSQQQVASQNGGSQERRAFFCDNTGLANLKYALLESDKTVYLNVARLPASGPVSIRWATRDGTAKSPADYEASGGTLDFGDGEVSKRISVNINDDDATEEEETFFVDLLEATYYSNASSTSKDQKENGKSQMMVVKQCDLGEGTTAEVTIIDDDEPGEIGFEPPTDGANNTLKKARESCGSVRILIKRFNGACDTVSCDFNTKSGTAIAGRDFEPATGRLVFAPKEVEKYIEIPIVNNSSYDLADAHEFTVELTNCKGPTSRACFTPYFVCTVRIVSDSDTKEIIDGVLKYMETNSAHQIKLKRPIKEQWIEQFTDAFLLPGAHQEDEEDGTGKKSSERGRVSCISWIMFLLMFPWKVAFAFIPPTEYKGGYPSFVISLVYIGICTAMIGDVAALFGCVLGLPDTVTAITFVAMGTSVPDTFASKSAVVNDTSADSAIGNITGSNAVNVFLGLGLPWTIASCYWTLFANGDGPAGKVWRNKYGGRDNDGGGGSKGPKKARHIGDDQSLAFIVPAGDLSVSVGTFLVCAVMCLSLIFYRRKTTGAELGGNKRLCNIHAMCLFSLWLTYISMSSASAFGAFSTADP